MAITILIALFLGEMLGNKIKVQKFDFGKIRYINNPRLLGSDTLPTRIKGCKNDTP
jgi:hypothetical protein